MPKVQDKLRQQRRGKQAPEKKPQQPPGTTLKNKADAKKLKAMAKKKKQTERFIRTRMWFSTFISAFFRDRGSIPPNIGNNIMIGNNLVITKGGIQAVIIIHEMSTDTPIGWCSDMVQKVKDKVENINIDITWKNIRHPYSMEDSSLKGRIRSWETLMDNPYIQDSRKRRTARLLYTVECVKNGAKTYYSNIYITLTAQDGSTLQRGLEQTAAYLSSIGATAQYIRSDLKKHLDYKLIMSDHRSAVTKDFPTQAMSLQTLAESMPITQGMNDSKGTFLGVDTRMNGPYFIDFRSTAKAKNIVVAAASGAGKTFLVQNWFMDMHAEGYNMCIMDIKGTEFGAFTKVTGGIQLSMRPDSTYYVNTWKLDKSEAGADPRVYFDERFGLSKEVMMILADLPAGQTSQGEALIEEFLQSVYLEMGVTAANVNTWYRSEALTPYVIFDKFEAFCSTGIRAKYACAEHMLTRLRIYMSRNGSSSHMFRDAFDYKDVLETKVLTFDFGLLGAGESTDQAMFKVRVLYMSLLNDQYVNYKYSRGEWTGKVLEESGIAADYLIRLYAKDFMLRRAQNQVTIMLGNSVSSLASNPNAQGILENANILCLGSLNRASRDYLIEEFGLDKECDELEDLARNPENMNTFLLINKMQKDATTALLRAHVPEHVVKGRLFKIVDTVDD